MSGNRLVVEDSEAQKAVEALLALKSPSHYSSNADEEEEYLLPEEQSTEDNVGFDTHYNISNNLTLNLESKRNQSPSHAQHLENESNQLQEAKFYIKPTAEKTLKTNSHNVNEFVSKARHEEAGIILNRQVIKNLSSDNTKDRVLEPLRHSNDDSPQFKLLKFVPLAENIKNNPSVSNLETKGISKLEKALTQALPNPPCKQKHKEKALKSEYISDCPQLSENNDQKSQFIPKRKIEDPDDTRKLISSPSKFCFGIASNKILDDTLLADKNCQDSDLKLSCQTLLSESQISAKSKNLSLIEEQNTRKEFRKKFEKDCLQKSKKSILNATKFSAKQNNKGNLENLSKHDPIQLDKRLNSSGPKFKLKRASVKGISSKKNKRSKLKLGKSKLAKSKVNRGKGKTKMLVKGLSQGVSPQNLIHVAPLQAYQLDNSAKKTGKEPDESNFIPITHESSDKVNFFVKTKHIENVKNKNPKESSCRFLIETDETLPIQAEVVMSEGSDCGGENSESNKRKKCIEEDINDYLKNFVSSNSLDPLIEYPTKNNELPQDGSNLTAWQLDEVRLPRFTPLVDPPPWLRLTIPAEGYCCQSCGDTFFIESSLVQHRERRSIWISLECGPCDAQLTFYNRCAFKDHIREHLLRGECVDEETVTVRSLPLQLTKLLQPIRVPVPESLRPSKNTNRSSPKPFYSRASNDKENFDCNDILSNFGAIDSGNNFALLSPSLSPTPLPSDSNRLSPKKRPIRCYLCERMFHNVRELMTHMRTNQPWSDQRVECRKCLLVLPSVCAAKAHILTHPPANSSNISVCPECGSRCDGLRDFVHHLNTCGHQFRRSGILCVQCQVCFFKISEDFFSHWLKEHCPKTYECILCSRVLESPAFHHCTSNAHLVLPTFRCYLACPMCNFKLHMNTQDEKQTCSEMENHLKEIHPTITNRVHYIFKSKFCTNAFRSKDELRAHHDREHRKDDHYTTETCTLHLEVLNYQEKYFDGQEPRDAFITVSIMLSQEEMEEAQMRDVPTVSSVADKNLLPNKSISLPLADKVKVEKSNVTDVQEPENHPKDLDTLKEKDMNKKLKPSVCYQCGFTYTDGKHFKKHKRICEGETAERLCQCCGFSAKGEEFARHCHSHMSEGLIICIFCNGAQFQSTKELHQHFEFHTKDQFLYPVTCVFCSFSMSDESSAFSHLVFEHDSHRFSFDYECERCGRKFHGERGLNIHLTRCSVGTVNPTPVPASGRQCQVCKKGLTPEMFGKHIVSHLEEGLLVCSLCDGLLLPSSMALLHHLDEHSTTLVYPVTCPMCSLEMREPEGALTHLKEDHGFGNLSCPECEMHYNFTYQLQRHMDIVHKVCLYAKRRYICWICRAFDHVKKETLINHFRSVHGLSVDEVDEKAVIRTRGQGTMPSAQFIPTKPLGNKEVSSNSQNKGDKIDDSSSKAKSPSSSKIDSQGSAIFEENENKKELQSPKSMVPPIEETIIKKELPDSLEDYFGDNETSNNVSQSLSDMHLKPVKKERIPSDTSQPELTNKSPCFKSSKMHSRIFTTIYRMGNGLKHCKNTSPPKRKKKYCCKKCKFGTNTKSKFERHQHKHSRNAQVTEGFVCKECGDSFVVEPSLIRHMFFAHKIKKQVPSESPPTEVPTPQQTCEVKTNGNGNIASPPSSSPTKRKPKRIPRERNPPKNTKNRKNSKRKLSEKEEAPKPIESYDETDSDLKCCVCQKEFSTSIKLYSHLRTHGMAFLKLGYKKRTLCQ